MSRYVRPVGTPIADITDTLATMTEPNGAMLLERGGEWRGLSIIPPRDSLYFGSYGSGSLPLLNGAEIITDWEAHPSRENIWVTPSPLIGGDGSSFRTVVVIDDDRFMPVLWESLDADLEYYPLNNTGTINDSVYVYSVADPTTRTAELSVKLNGIQDGWNRCIYRCRGCWNG